MRKNILLLVMIIILGVAILGCGTQNTTKNTAEYFESNDLLMVQPDPTNLRVTFFFENHRALWAQSYNVTIKFNPFLEKPIVKSSVKSSDMIIFEGEIKNVEIVFRDKQQMAEYWDNLIVK